MQGHLLCPSFISWVFWFKFSIQLISYFFLHCFFPLFIVFFSLVMLEKHQRNTCFRQSLPPCPFLLAPSTLSQVPSPSSLPVFCFEGGPGVCLCKRATPGRAMGAPWDAAPHHHPPALSLKLKLRFKARSEAKISAVSIPSQIAQGGGEGEANLFRSLRCGQNSACPNDPL